ncbi:ABC transporter permease [Crossiella cryophila]|uniref:Transport permease protein n=1 Tax=Crossiella cryophila TaxID=43355 RepID=A0A7W7CGX0_9PSEU|nr:ABC transporter permease [Crossiella cryophila]MBB4679279.1 ABC-2 type transport system permease protein [Crossiella cryophila]
MSTLTYAARDSITMLRRDLRHAQRYPLMTVSSIMMPLLMMLLFVFVFGNAMSPVARTGNYLDYLTPGIIVMAIGSASGSAVAIKVCMDMQEGIIARFRTMSISRGSVLSGQVLGSLIRTLVSVALIIVLAVLMGFRPTAGVGEWLAVLGLVSLVIIAFTWLAVAIGLATKTVGGANTAAFPLQFLPFLSSAFIPTAAMSDGVALVAQYQPFTPIIDTLRGLLTGTPIGTSWIFAIGWCLLLTAIGYFCALRRYNADTSQ